MRRPLRLLPLTAALALACHSSKPQSVGHTSNPGPHPVGSTTFSTELGPNGGSSTGVGGGLAQSATDGAAPTAGTTNTGSGSSTPPTVTESDIYYLDTVHNLLYVVNHYRGLQIIDISNPNQPTLLGQAPIYSWPGEMYLDGTNVYILDSDYYDYWVEGPGVSWSHGSRVDVFDVSNPAAPQALSSVNVDGQINDSRIVGNVLYLIAQRYSWWDNPATNDDTTETVIVSVNVSNPANVQVVATQEFPQNGYNQQIMVTPYTVYVANGNYDYNSELYNTDIQYVDISDPNGNMVLRGSINVPGMVQDRWSMDEYDDSNLTGANAAVLRVASSQDWSEGAGYLTTWSVVNPDSITKLGSYTLNTGTGVTTASFDGPNGYLVSQSGTNALYAMDLSDPTHPALLGQPSMTGYLDYLAPNGTQLLTLGHVLTVDSNGDESYALEVSLLNTPGGTTPTVVGQQQIGANWGWVPSSTDDYAKVFQVLQLADHGLVIMPFQSWNPQNYSYDGGVQLLDFTSSALTVQGLIQNAGDVERGVPDGNMVLTIADDRFQIIDITDESNPQFLSSLELSRDVQDFAPLDSNWAVQLSGDWYQGDMSIVMTPLMDPDNVAPPAELHIPSPYGHLYTNGNMAYVASVMPWNGNQSPVTVVQVADLTNRTAPVLRGSVSLPSAVYPSYDYWYWGYGDQVAQVNGSTLAFLQYNWGWYVCEGCPDWTAPTTPPDTIYFTDLSNPDQPVVASTFQLSDASWVWGLQAIGSVLYLSEYKAYYENGNYWANYYVNHIDASDPANPKSLGEVNVPGQFISANGDTIYALEQYWDESGQTYNQYLHALEFVNGGTGASLLSSVSLPGYVDNVIVNGSTAFISTWIESQQSNGSWSYSMQFLTVDLTDPNNIAVSSTNTLPVQYAYLQSVQGGLAFFGMYPGLLAYNVTDPSNPVFQSFYRTEGWSDELILDGSNLFVPSGDYGVQIINVGQ